MKNSIIVALVSLGIIAVARVLMFLNTFLATGMISTQFFIPTILVVLGFIGIIKGYRIAWQWGRLLGLLGAILFCFIAIVSVMQISKRPYMTLTSIVSAIQAILLFIMYFALGTIGAREYFNVLCSDCGKTKVKAGDFLFKKVICSKCKKEWS